MSFKEDFIKHACEQVLRFTNVEKWNDLSEEIKVQLGFNMGVVALGLKLSKEEGFLIFLQMQKGEMSIQDFHEHLKNLVSLHKIEIDESKITKPFY